MLNMLQDDAARSFWITWSYLLFVVVYHMA
jgi:hypothetical protein